MYKAQITHQQDMAFKVTCGQDQFIIDAKGKGLTPLDALLSGLGSCIGVYIRKYSDGAGLGLNNFEVTVSGELSGQPPFTFRSIDVVIDLKGAQLELRRQKALLEFIKNCPAHNTLKGNPAMEFKLC